MNDAPRQHLPGLPYVPMDSCATDSAPAQPTSPWSHQEMAAVGARAGLLTGLFLAPILAALALADSELPGGSGSTWPMVVWFLGGPLLAAVFGGILGVAGVTQKELAGCLVGGVLGAVAGGVHSGLLKPVLAPLRDPAIHALRQIALGLFLGLLIGAAIGLLHTPIWNYLRRRSGWYRMSAVEQEIRDDINRRAGI